MSNKIIIFSEFSEFCKIIYREVQQYNPLIIIGETPHNKRQEIIDLFNHNLEHKILILSSAGQYGLNVQVANIVIHADQPWSVKGKIQREGRVHRKGQTASSVLVYNLLAGPIDLYIKKLLEKKFKISDDVLDEGDVISSQAEIQEALALEPVFVE